jgi:uncharacterized protein HemX
VRRAFMVLTAVVYVATVAAPAAAQEPTTSSTTVAVPSQDIIPRPNSGSEPQEAGDRGGALQLGLLALVVVAIGGTVLVLVRRSRQTQGGG